MTPTAMAAELPKPEPMGSCDSTRRANPGKVASTAFPLPRPSSPRPSSPAPSQPPSPGEEGEKQDRSNRVPPLPVRGVGGGGRGIRVNLLRVGAGLDGWEGARPALQRRDRLPQGGSSPQPAVQTRPYPRQRGQS